MCNRHLFPGNVKEVSTPQSASDVEEPAGRGDGRDSWGKMDAKLGTTLGNLGTSLLKAIDALGHRTAIGEVEGPRMKRKTRISRSEQAARTNSVTATSGSRTSASAIPTRLPSFLTCALQ